MSNKFGLWTFHKL